MIDNQGTVSISKKGYSLKCTTTDSLLRACNYVAVQLSAKAYIKKIRRCSSSTAKIADAISKGDWPSRDLLHADRELDPSTIPTSLVRWLDNPVPTINLGPRVVKELQAKWGIIPLFEPLEKIDET